MMMGHIVTRDHPLFDHENELNSQALIVLSYSLATARNGPQAIRAWASRQNSKLTDAELEELSFRDPDDFPGNLRHCFDEVYVDEAQNLKGFDCHANPLVRCLQGTSRLEVSQRFTKPR